MKHTATAIAAIATLAALASPADADPARWVNPFTGTGATGHTFPGACVPFGMIQASPDTGTENWAYCGGYQFNDKTIRGFSQTHLNGTGGIDLGDILLTPFTGDCGADGSKAAEFAKADERAEAGYYAVTFPETGIRTEITASERAGFYRFSAPPGKQVRLLVDCQWGIASGGNAKNYVLSHSAAQDGDFAFSGTRETKNWNRRTSFFTIEFNRKIASVAKLDKRDRREKGSRYAIDFAPGEGPLMAKIALSRTSAEGAKRNLAANGGWDFDAVKKSARAKWNAILSRTEAEGTDEEKRNFYTAMYHLFIQPNIMSDEGEKLFHSTFSTWDTFRAAHPLYTIVAPETVPGMIDSMLEQDRITGFLPIWTLWGGDNQCMIGTHSIPVIVDWFLKSGAPGNDYWRGVYARVRETLTAKHEIRRKENWDVYDMYGYYPFDKIKGESVSRTLECAYDDWCAGTMAEKLGFADDAAFFFKRSSYWKNVFDPKLKLVRGRNSAGEWRTPYNPYALGHGGDTANDFTEGNAFQYTWHVMQDPDGLIAAMGGRAEFVKALDSLFTQPEAAEGQGKVLDVTGLIGQYVHGNEPSHHVIYFYTLAGRPDRTAERVRDVFDRFYRPTPEGLCGNDDCGQMSAWYIFSAMGFYPFNPCGGEYVIGAPQLPKIALSLPGGKKFTVVAKDLSRENKYAKSATLDGRPFDLRTITHAEIMRGGELVFQMGAK